MTQWNQLIIDFAIPRTENFTVLSLMVESSEVRKLYYMHLCNYKNVRIINKTELSHITYYMLSGRFRSGHYKVYQMMSYLLKMQ